MKSPVHPYALRFNDRDALARMLEPDYDFVIALLWGGLFITVSVAGALWLR